MFSTDNLGKLTLAMLPGVTVRTINKVIDTVGSVAAVFRLDDCDLLRAGFPEKITRHVIDSTMMKASEEIMWANSHNVNILLWDDPRYPQRFGVIARQPGVIYTVGNTDLNTMPTVGIVGTRHSTLYGNAFTKHLVKDLSTVGQPVCIVSGLAYGIDIAAHRTALDLNMPTIGIVAHGLSTMYPASHRETARTMAAHGGMVMSEYPHAQGAWRDTFLDRNRLIAALSDILVIVESAEKGGALSTVAAAHKYGRPVMALPGRITDTYSQGCNMVINRGLATAIVTPESVAKAMGWKTKTKPTAAPTVDNETQRIIAAMEPEEKEILRFILTNDNPTETLIMKSLDLGDATIITTLTAMEMKNLVNRIPGARYRSTITIDPALLVMQRK